MQRKASISYLDKPPADYKRILFVSYRAPSSANLKKEEGDLVNSGIFGAVRSLLEAGKDVIWVGIPAPSVGSKQAAPIGEDTGKVEIESDVINPHLKIVPVHVKETDAQLHLRDFCKGVLWPLLHHYGTSVKQYSAESWQAYCSVNQEFARQVVNNFQLGDLVIVHDYHLMMVPQYIRSEVSFAKIGFFLHSPWPSSEMYRSLPIRDALLRSLVQCDLIGFQTYSFAKHFMSACTRLLGLIVTDKGVECEDGHFVNIEVMPVGIIPEDFLSLMELDSVKNRVNELLQTYKGKKIIISRDPMEWVSGIPQKLKAFQMFLKTYPEWRDKVVFIQICRPNTDTVMEARTYQELCEQVEEIVGSINGEFGTISAHPLLYFYQSFSTQKMAALFSIADVALITPLRDGMNLTALEFTACQNSKMSPIILSEFTGAAGCLGGAIVVNPWNEKKVSKAINSALLLGDDVKKLRHHYNFGYITKHTAEYWISYIAKSLASTSTTRKSFGTSFPILEAKEAYDQSSKRVLFLDYDGTLTPKKRLPKEATPSDSTLKIIKTLGEDIKNHVYIVSGRDRKFLEEFFHGLRVGLAAEHGNFVRKPPKLGEEDNFIWEERSKNIDMRWKQDVLKILNDVVDVTPGSFVEVKDINLTWHYRNADPEFAEWQMRELLVHLQGLPKSPIDILIGSKNVEVRPQGVNKGTFVRGVLTGESNVDFLLCIGDDKTDEDMFQEVLQYDVKYLFSTTVEKKPTTANFYIETQPEVLDILADLSK